MDHILGTAYVHEVLHALAAGRRVALMVDGRTNPLIIDGIDIQGPYALVRKGTEHSPIRLDAIMGYQTLA